MRGAEAVTPYVDGFANSCGHQIMHVDTRFLNGKDEVPKNEMTTIS